MTIPLHSKNGTPYVPELLDELAPSVASARIAATKAHTAHRTAQAAAREAREAYYALAERNLDGEWVVRGDVSQTAYDKARMARFKADAEELTAERNSTKARESFYRIASEALTDPDVRDALVSRWDAAEAATGAAWDTLSAALDARTELDKLLGVRSLPYSGLQIAAQSVKPGDVLRVREVTDEHLGDAYALKTIAGVVKPARIFKGDAR